MSDMLTIPAKKRDRAGKGGARVTRAVGGGGGFVGGGCGGV